MMWFSMLIVLMLWLSSKADQRPRACSCVEDTECLTMAFNQLTIEGIIKDLGKLLDAQEVPKEGQSSTACLNRIRVLKDRMKSLEKKYDQLTSSYRWWDDRTFRMDLIRTEPIMPDIGDVDHCQVPSHYRAMDCADIQLKGNTKSDVYTIYPKQTEESIDVFCDLTTDEGGWTVFLSRQPQDEPLSFNTTWDNFKNGFGNPSTENWLGNDNLHTLTSLGPSEMRFDAKNYEEEERWAKYGDFSVADEALKYKLKLTQYDPRSTMGDNLGDNNMTKFTTIDSNNGEHRRINCAGKGRRLQWGEGGFWYAKCGFIRPTAPLQYTNKSDSAWLNYWVPQQDSGTSLKILTMKFRRTNHKQIATCMGH